MNIDKIVITRNDLYESEHGLIRCLDNGSNYTEFIVNPSNTGLISSVITKYTEAHAKNLEFECFGYPFFPISNKLYVRTCHTNFVDKLIESQLSTDRLYGSTIGEADISLIWKPVQIMKGLNGTVDVINNTDGQRVSSIAINNKTETTNINNLKLKQDGNAAISTENNGTLSELSMRSTSLPTLSIPAESFNGVSVTLPAIESRGKDNIELNVTGSTESTDITPTATTQIVPINQTISVNAFNDLVVSIPQTRANASNLAISVDENPISLTGNVTAALTNGSVVNLEETPAQIGKVNNTNVTVDTTELKSTINNNAIGITGADNITVPGQTVPIDTSNLTSTGTLTIEPTATTTINPITISQQTIESRGTIEAGSITVRSNSGALTIDQQNPIDISTTGAIESNGSGNITTTSEGTLSNITLDGDSGSIDIPIPNAIDISDISLVINNTEEVNTAERLVAQLTIEPISIPINTIITIAPNSVIYVYITGNNQWYPLWRSNHTLQYKILN
jgi:hypothetical protein